MIQFVVLVVNNSRFTVWADGITRRRSAVYFWMKREHWYSRRRCVAMVDWKVVAGVWKMPPQQSSEEIAKELGVKL
jgi:hypothetical protein